MNIIINDFKSEILNIELSIFEEFGFTFKPIFIAKDHWTCHCYKNEVHFAGGVKGSTPEQAIREEMKFIEQYIKNQIYAN